MERIATRLGKPIEVQADPQRVRPAASEVGRLLAGTKLAQELFDWKPAYSLDDGLDETIAWVKANPGLFRPGEYTT